VATALAAGLALGACGDGAEDDATLPAPVEAAPSEAPATPADGASTAEGPSSGAPAYADAYPGAEILPAGDATETDLGGSITFTTSDSPEAVIDFYQARAREGGLSTVSALKQGQTQAYAAVDPEGRGATLQVIAAPAEGDDSQTQVSVTWTVAQ
jgi:hypothetical protein